MAATKKQEYEALKKIKEIVDSLGKDSYIATAFEGCFDIAKENIMFDFMSSMKHRYESAQCEIDELKAEIDEVESLKERITQLEKALDRELEWKPYVSKNSVSQSEYEKLEKDSDTRVLSEGEAKSLLYAEFGFAPERIAIIDSVIKYEINRHGMLREVGSIPRKPLYNSTDWYYVKFCAVGNYYEAWNGQLRPRAD